MESILTARARRLVACFLTLIPLSVYGWGRDGHQLVGDIASHFLSPAASAKVAELLTDDLDASGQPSGRTTLGEVASWPDEIRSTAAGKGKSGWHFDDVPVCGNVPRSQWCADGNCASDQIVRFYGVLVDKTSTAREKNEALKWIVHLVGDIHQPLHSADDDDRGGNTVVVTFGGKRTNLHSIWDAQIVQRLVREKSLTGDVMARSISTPQQKAWVQGDSAAGTSINRWATESNLLARNVAYGKLPGGFACGSALTKTLAIQDDYYNSAAVVVEEQLEKAGYRLAGILNAAFQQDGAAVANATPSSATAPSPVLATNKPVDWWFVFKLNSKAFAGCGAQQQRVCTFGGEVQTYTFGQQFVYASKEAPGLQQGDGCVGTTAADPLGATFSDIYNNSFYYVIWNDQFYGDPEIAGCGDSCGSPWGHSKGALAWNEEGEGVVIQVSTPSWPASGSKRFPRKTDGNTLGCVKDDDVEVSQHFFSLKLSADDVRKVLAALGNASVVTNPEDPQIVNNGGPADIQQLVSVLGKKSKSTRVTKDALSTGVQLISKPSSLHVPPWQMVSALLDGAPLRTATWWAKPWIYSTTESFDVTCWDASLGKPGAVAIALSGRWNGKVFGLKGGPGPDFNHAKIGVSTDPQRTYAIFGDMNQQGARDGEKCSSSQNGRGGLFYVVSDKTLVKSIADLIEGDTAPVDAP